MAKQEVVPSRPSQPGMSPTQNQPKTVLGAKFVRLALISYLDESNQTVTGLAVIGDNNVHLLESRVLGFSTHTTRQGLASEWLRKGVFEKLMENAQER